MREIKFRLWDAENQQMIGGDELAFEEYAPISHLLTQPGIMQYTGLHDKNGKEIYEGDILRVRRPGRDQQTHYGDNIPLGSYTEPLEAIIHEYETEVKFADGVFGCEVEDTENVPLHWVIGDVQAADEQQLKEMFSGGWGDRIFEGWEDDKEYLFEKCGVTSVDELIHYIGAEVTGNVFENQELLKEVEPA